MTARLIAARQIVVLCDNQHVRLFYHGRVYIRSAKAGFKHLPEHLTEPYFPMWGLIDVDSEPRIRGGSDIWPIHSSSPEPVQWRAWKKQDGAALLGMPLWGMDELMQGCAVLPFCH